MQRLNTVFKKEFHKRMTRLFDDSNDLQIFSDIVDTSVNKKGESGIYQYMDMVEKYITISKDMNYDSKGLNL